MKKNIMLLILAVLMPLSAMAQGQKPVVIELWPNGAPSDNGLRGEEIDYVTHVSNVTVPTLTIYPAANPNGKAILACPGGGYVDVWALTEGHQMAEWMNSQGITYAVLKYRLPNGHKDIPLEDVHRAMDILHERQAELGFNMLGIQGNSAGGHLASTAATHYVDAATRPDFQILLYPVITMDTSFTHTQTRENFLGKNPTQELVDMFSNEKQVTADTPPAFIAHSSDDVAVPTRNSLDYYAALQSKGVSASLHIYPTGNHGWGFRDDFIYKPQWTAELAQWLRTF